MKLWFSFSFSLIVLGSILHFIPIVNQALFLAINSLLPNTHLWMAITVLGDGAIAGCLFYLFFRKRGDLLLKGLIAAVLGLLTSQGLKKLFAAPRPEHTAGFENFHLLTESMAVTNFSMPSGHSLTAFLLGVFLLRYSALNLVGKMLVAVLMAVLGFSRIALGVHWPADVLVGAGLGIFVAVICGALPINIQNNRGVRAIHILYLPFALLIIYKYFL